MNKDQELIVEFFEKQWPVVSEAAKIVWGNSQATGKYDGTITCPKDGVIKTERFVDKVQWEEMTKFQRFCVICGKRLKIELSKEHVYEFTWRANLLEMMLDSKVFETRMNELKGIKPDEIKEEPKME